MITHLTPAQRDALDQIRDRWLNIGLSTEPADRPAARAAVDVMYRQGGLAPPRLVIWMDNPLHGVIAVTLLAGGVRDQVSAQVRAQVLDQVRAQVRAQVSDQVRAQVSAQVRDQVLDQVRDQVRAQVREFIRLDEWWYWWWPGQFDAWLSYFDYMGAALGLDVSRLDGLMGAARSCGLVLPLPDAAVCVERPAVIRRDARGRLHALNGPALAYPDGWAIHAVHGIRVPGYVIEQPETITVADIEAERNAEHRRIKIDRYDAVRCHGAYLQDSGAELVHADSFGKLWRKQRPGDTPLLMVEVSNSTAHPDGTRPTYFLRVDPELRPMRRKPDATVEFGRPQAPTARNAVASTFFRRGEEYAPEHES